MPDGQRPFGACRRDRTKNAAQVCDTAWVWGRARSDDDKPKQRFSDMRSRTPPAGMFAAELSAP
jgi:hypothetical protein